MKVPFEKELFERLGHRTSLCDRVKAVTRRLDEARLSGPVKQGELNVSDLVEYARSIISEYGQGS